ncbi:hypothetical protein ACFQO1_03400 [Jejudonia soesokkakensis]|uniref:Uncharacterized protein n=1 Tax=Jejudonia soesokkakensis TaxID=1323432 RepID=A0ABW2MS67_9FLAO
MVPYSDEKGCFTLWVEEVLVLFRKYLPLDNSKPLTFHISRLTIITHHQLSTINYKTIHYPWSIYGVSMEYLWSIYGVAISEESYVLKER